MKPKIYLDIDGVILANDRQAANYAEDLLSYLTDNYNTYWLTTHVHGDTAWVKEYLCRFLSPEAMKAVEKIKVTPKDWKIAKTEAIDFSKPFLWLDDDLFPEEREDLMKHNVLDGWIEIDLAKNEDQLLEVLSYLKGKY